MPSRWSEVKAEHVMRAVELYDRAPDAYTRAKHTYLLVNGKPYPAKAIRGIAYQVCYGEPISQQEFTGGAQTARFFENLGFEVLCGSADARPVAAKPIRPPASSKRNRHVDMPVQVNVRPTVEGDPVEWRKLEIDFQRIRLNYMKWFFHFTPPEVDPTGKFGAGDAFKLFNVDNGRGFTVFPCGMGSAYVGGGQGCVRLPERCFAAESRLVEETGYLKQSLSRRTGDAKEAMLTSLRAGRSDSAWRMLLEYWWLKLGLHEFAYDVTYIDKESREPHRDIRDFVFKAMALGLTASELDTSQFVSDEVEHFIRHQITWNRFACCSFDCGPIALGKPGYVPYEEMAEARRGFFAGRDVLALSLDDARLMARDALSGCCDFLMLYYEKPMSSMFYYGGFRENRQALATAMSDTQKALNSIIRSEGLDMPVFDYVPR